MKSLLKKLGMFVLAVVMTVGMGMTVLADEIRAEIHINRMMTGDTMTAYPLITYNTGYDDYVVEEHFKSFLESKGVTDDEVETYLQNLGSAGLSKLIGEYLTSSQCVLPTAAASGIASGSRGGTAVLHLGPGYYLLRGTTEVTNGTVYTPMMVFVRANADELEVYGGDEPEPLDKTTGTDYYDLEVKSTTGPTISKKVKSNSGSWGDVASAGVGDTVDFYIRVVLPYYEDLHTVNLTVEDTMVGMEYVQGSARLYYRLDSGESEIKNGVSNTSEESGVRKWTLDYGEIAKLGQSIVYLTYQAKITDSAAESAKASNEAKLTYTLNTESGSTNTSKTKVFNYALKINKQDASGKALAGAGFSVYTNSNCTDGRMNFAAKKDSDNKVEYYYPVKAGTEGAVTVIPSDGMLLIKGLADGVFYLKEEQTPKGYYAPKKGMQIRLSVRDMDATYDFGMLDSGETSIEALDNADQSLIGNHGVDTEKGYQFNAAIINTSTPLLPSTGGAGTALFTVCGVVLMILGVYVFFFRKKEKKQQ